MCYLQPLTSLCATARGAFPSQRGKGRSTRTAACSAVGRQRWSEPALRVGGFGHGHLETDRVAQQAGKGIRSARTPSAGPLEFSTAPPAQSQKSILGDFWSSTNHCQDKSLIMETCFFDVPHTACSGAVPQLWYPMGREHWALCRWVSAGDGAAGAS